MENQKRDRQNPNKSQTLAPEEDKWYEDRATLIALITGLISSTLSLINVFLGIG